jgi:antitoxin (DNA-binding transcriptional repressor) of toxin-antitoxin stability system
MRTYTVSEITADFKKILPFVQKGEKIGIAYKKANKPVAMLMPFKESKHPGRKIGILEGKAYFKEFDNGKITEEEFLGL